MSDYQKEQEEKVKNINTNIKYIYEGIKSEIEKKGMTINIEDKNRFGEHLRTLEIVITHKDFPDLYANISGNWHQKDRARVYFKNARSVKYELKNYYSDGTSNTESIDYDFDYKVSNDELENIGIPRGESSYRRSLSMLSFDFKANKNIKLILRDFIPALEKALEVLKIASPKIDEQIKRELEVLDLQNKVKAFSKYNRDPNTSHKVSTQQTTIEGLGEVTIDYNGSIELKKSISKDELFELLKGVK